MNILLLASTVDVVGRNVNTVCAKNGIKNKNEEQMDAKRI